MRSLIQYVSDPARFPNMYNAEPIPNQVRYESWREVGPGRRWLEMNRGGWGLTVWMGAQHERSMYGGPILHQVQARRGGGWDSLRPQEEPGFLNGASL